MNEKEFNRNCDGTDYGNWVPLNMMKAMGGVTGHAGAWRKSW